MTAFNRHRLWIALIIGFGFVFLLSGTVMAQAPKADSVCLTNSANAPAGFCGDGICDPYIGENKTTCPADCGTPGGGGRTPADTATPLPTAVPTVAPTSTIVPSILVVIPTTAPSATATGAGTATVQPTSGGPTPTAGGLQPTVTPAQVAESAQTGTAGCGLVAYESRTSAWQRAYTGSSNNFIPRTSSKQEVFVCSVPPAGQICIPTYDGLLTAVRGNEDQIVLVDCSADGKCSLHTNKVELVGGNICALVTPGDQISCQGGCAFAPSEASLLGLPFLSSPFLSQLPQWTPIACLLGVLMVALIGLLIVVSRRRSDQDDRGRSASGGAGADSV